MTTVTAEYPFINVAIDTRGLQPVARRSVGNIAVIGSRGGGGTALAGVPVQIGDAADARKYLVATDATTGAVIKDSEDNSPLYRAVLIALQQNPGPTRVYAIATDDQATATPPPPPPEGGEPAASPTPSYTAALTAAEALSVQFVCLAGESDPTQLADLKKHVETLSKGGDARIGVAMVDPALTAGDSGYAQTADTKYGGLKSDDGRMVLVAARAGKDGDNVPDVAAAATGAIAGLPAEASVLLKQVSGIKIPLERQFSGSEVKELAEKFIVPLIDPELIPGEALYFGSGRTYTTNTALMYVDTVRVIDQIDFMLKAGLIGSIGDTRIDRLGMQCLRSSIVGILGPLVTSGVIDGYDIDIPLLPILEAEESTRSPDQADVLSGARKSRIVNVMLSVTYAGSIHFLDVHLALKA